MVDLEQLKRFTQGMVEIVKRNLQRDQELAPTAMIHVPDTKRLQEGFQVREGWLIIDLASFHNSASAYAAIRKMTKELQADAAIVIADGYSLQSTKEQQKKMTALVKRKGRKYLASLSTEEMEEMGLGNSVETLAIIAQTPLINVFLTIPYLREEEGIRFDEPREMTGNNFGSCRLFEEPPMTTITLQ